MFESVSFRAKFGQSLLEFLIHKVEAEKGLVELESLAKQKYVTAYGVALIHAGLGQKDLAFQWLNKAFDERSHWLVWLRLDPRWGCSAI
jgi:hypothetical protein